MSFFSNEMSAGRVVRWEGTLGLAQVRADIRPNDALRFPKVHIGEKPIRGRDPTPEELKLIVRLITSHTRTQIYEGYISLDIACDHEVYSSTDLDYIHLWRVESMLHPAWRAVRTPSKHANCWAIACMQTGSEQAQVARVGKQARPHTPSRRTQVLSLQECTAAKA